MGVCGFTLCIYDRKSAALAGTRRISRDYFILKEDINMLNLEKVTGKNIWDILKLCVFEKQKNYQVLWQNVMVR